jgi:hypothetical protein
VQQQVAYPTVVPLAVVPASLRFVLLGLLDLPGRPECRPTLYLSARHALELVDEDMVTGVGAATEVPSQDWCRA